MATNKKKVNDRAVEKKKAIELGTLSNDFNFSVIEAYKAIRTNLIFSLPKDIKCPTVLFTSAVPGEGKTTTSVNTAITVAQASTKTIILDCDIRKPRIHTKFGLTNEIGMSNVLSGLASLEEAVRPTGKENLWTITSGVLPPNPAELLASEAMAELIKRLKESFEYIVIDSTPVNIVADALSLTKIADGVVVVAKQNSTTHPYLKEALSKLEFVDAAVLGIVLNGAMSTGGKYYNKRYSRYGYKYRYGYGKGYGYGYGSYGYGGYGYGGYGGYGYGNNQSKKDSGK